MEYSKDIILNINYKNEGQAENNKLIGLLKKHRFVTTISTICGILMIADCTLVYNFIRLLQSMY